MAAAACAMPGDRLRSYRPPAAQAAGGPAAATLHRARAHPQAGLRQRVPPTAEELLALALSSGRVSPLRPARSPPSPRPAAPVPPAADPAAAAALQRLRAAEQELGQLLRAAGVYPAGGGGRPQSPAERVAAAKAALQRLVAGRGPRSSAPATQPPEPPTPPKQPPPVSPPPLLLPATQPSDSAAPGRRRGSGATRCSGRDELLRQLHDSEEELRRVRGELRGTPPSTALTPPAAGRRPSLQSLPPQPAPAPARRASTAVSVGASPPPAAECREAAVQCEAQDAAVSTADAAVGSPPPASAAASARVVHPGAGALLGGLRADAASNMLLLQTADSFRTQSGGRQQGEEASALQMLAASAAECDAPSEAGPPAARAASDALTAQRADTAVSLRQRAAREALPDDSVCETMRDQAVYAELAAEAAVSEGLRAEVLQLRRQLDEQSAAAREAAAATVELRRRCGAAEAAAGALPFMRLLYGAQLDEARARHAAAEQAMEAAARIAGAAQLERENAALRAAEAARRGESEALLRAAAQLQSAAEAGGGTDALRDTVAAAAREAAEARERQLLAQSEQLSELRDLRELLSARADHVPRAELEAAQAQVRRLEAECEALRARLAESTGPAALLACPRIDLEQAEAMQRPQPLTSRRVSAVRHPSALGSSGVRGRRPQLSPLNASASSFRRVASGVGTPRFLDDIWLPPDDGDVSQVQSPVHYSRYAGPLFSDRRFSLRRPRSPGLSTAASGRLAATRSCRSGDSPGAQSAGALTMSATMVPGAEGQPAHFEDCQPPVHCSTPGSQSCSRLPPLEQRPSATLGLRSQGSGRPCAAPGADPPAPPGAADSALHMLDPEPPQRSAAPGGDHSCPPQELWDGCDQGTERTIRTPLDGHRIYTGAQLVASDSDSASPVAPADSLSVDVHNAVRAVQDAAAALQAQKREVAAKSEQYRQLCQSLRAVPQPEPGTGGTVEDARRATEELMNRCGDALRRSMSALEHSEHSLQGLEHQAALLQAGLQQAG
eukprot:TRINITY_DN10450_c0_g1_i1.p1 TRINITY_DN10450_c0_g1~~TRINITY_DN10450_c0_g1_i1.p1  ORF type:complete len:1038 (+),score=293.81 TRINITY_DN10450_c0_g1_i1:69-3116(+)